MSPGYFIPGNNGHKMTTVLFSGVSNSLNGFRGVDSFPDLSLGHQVETVDTPLVNPNPDRHINPTE